ncbi:pyridoxamine 5'-phosphate oxidase family protein [Streptomyces bambusae]|uniref:pyridoxamine 5'-phosphate oxidase family protein n=1 Tax=Streptomyces bambusae TaxID=1550616 RepID=UPI001CFEF83E|nr:pyridoxamine 5'-phosphate oxidase family protein [Streptomyces bambusae]MCB5167802.1 pyridoxamine 5'-phosphate oxidase family protein [Streptomyces bambusae]
MTTNNWAAFEAAEPEFAAVVRERFGLYPHHVLATLRKDGSPRVSGLNVEIRGGELWLGMMAGSLKARDLRHDPRFAVHANPGPDDTMPDGDVRIAGTAIELTDPPELHRFAEESPENADPHPAHVFRTELTEVVRTTLEADHLVITTWHPGTPLHTLHRGNDDEPPQEA